MKRSTKRCHASKKPSDKQVRLVFHPTDFDGLWVVEPAVHEDTRGCFFETYRQEIFLKHGIKVDFVQDNQSVSMRGVLRGFHYQIEPRAQAKLIRTVAGEIFDAVVDLRKHSLTYGRFFSIHLSAQNRKMLYIPAGFAHGFLTLSERAEVCYKVSEPYSPAHERGLRWDDPALGIQWPHSGVSPILSGKDQNYPGIDGVSV